MRLPGQRGHLNRVGNLKSVDDSLPFDLGFLEIDEQTQSPARGSQIVETLRGVFVGETLGTRAAQHGTYVLMLNGGAMQAHAAIGDSLPVISGGPFTVTAGQRAIFLLDSYGVDDFPEGVYFGTRPIAYVDGSAAWAYASWSNDSEISVLVDPPPNEQPGEHQLDVFLCGSFFMPFGWGWETCDIEVSFAVAAAEEPQCTLAVDSPANSQVFATTAGNYTQAQIPLDPVSDCSGTVNWSFGSNYTLINNTGAVYLGSVTNTVQTLNQAITFNTPPGNGGLTGMTVSASFGEQQSVLPYVEGSQIPNPLIVTSLDSMYSGATPTLLVGIAYRESSCAQFQSKVNPTYSLLGYWPLENFNGTYVGLMQVPPSQSTLFDWTANAATALNILQGFLSAAARYSNQEVAQYPNLPQLTALQQEQDALWLYGGYGTHGHYYVPNDSYNGWVVTTAYPIGFQYVQSVYSSAASNNCSR